MKELIELIESEKGVQITPCLHKTWDDCIEYSEEFNCIIIWYNTPDNSTHIYKI